MSYFDGPTDYLVRLAIVLAAGLVAALASLTLLLKRPAAQRPALLPVALGLGFAALLLALPLAFGPLIEDLAHLGASRAGAQATLMNSARVLLAGGAGLLLTLVVFCVGIAPALGTGAASGRSPKLLLAVTLVASVVAVGVFEYSRSGLNLTRYVLTALAETGGDPSELEEARERHAVLRDEPVSIAEVSEAMTRAAFVGKYGGALALLLVAGLGSAGFVLGRGAEPGRGLAQSGLLLAVVLATLTVFWMARLRADSAAIEDRHFGSRAIAGEPAS
jgi:hypothetical protein